MPRPYTLFTGQWADLPFEEVARLASGWGYDGLESPSPGTTWTPDGDPEGVRTRAAEEMKHTARLAKALGVDTVVGFTKPKKHTGSS